MQRKMIGDAKSGLSLRIEQTPLTMVLEARPDPLLLIVVVGTLCSVGIIDAVATSPSEGIVSFVLFTFLFLPLICVLGFNALRVRTRCVFDKGAMLMKISERSYTRHVTEEYSLDEARSVFLRRLPSAPLTGDTVTYGLFLELGSADYLMASGTNEHTLGQDAWRISRFLEVPLTTVGADVAPLPRRRFGVLLTASILYLLPVLLAISALLFLFDQSAPFEPSLVGLLSAVVISQIGAILAYAFYRTRRPYEG